MKFFKLILSFLLFILGVSFLTFLLAYLSPFDPIKSLNYSGHYLSADKKLELRSYLGLDNSFIIQYLSYLRKLFSLNLGKSFVFKIDIIDLILAKFANSLGVIIPSIIFSGIIGYFIGIYVSTNKNFISNFLTKLCLIITSLPSYLVAIIMIMIFAVKLKLLPVGLSSPIGDINPSIFNKISHSILPIITLSICSMPPIALHVSTSANNILKSDYVRLAKLRGVKKFKIIKRHIFKPTLMIAIMILAMNFSEIFMGNMILEEVFMYSGLGRALLLAATKGDFNLLVTATLFISTIVYISNGIADIILKRMSHYEVSTYEN